MKTKKTKVTKKVVTKKAKRGRPKGSTKKLNPTTQIVRAAMKVVSKDVRAPKVVREGKVKPKSSEIDDMVNLYKDKKISKQHMVEKKPKIKKIEPIPSGVACIGCGEDIPKQRIDACKGTNRCIKCSDVKTKKPIIVNHGTGDNIYQEVVIVDDETYRKHLKVEEATRKALGKPTSSNFFDEEEPKHKKPTDLEE